mmetsp:Transcript_76317/g.221541  ORF Transcript_76317/g.221541 Transcript_76317/m.221541 type:complete len:278 (-) Transcript_76317:414-1247(-)
MGGFAAITTTMNKGKESSAPNAFSGPQTLLRNPGPQPGGPFGPSGGGQATATDFPALLRRAASSHCFRKHAAPVTAEKARARSSSISRGDLCAFRCRNHIIATSTCGVSANSSDTSKCRGRNQAKRANWLESLVSASVGAAGKSRECKWPKTKRDTQSVRCRSSTLSSSANVGASAPTSPGPSAAARQPVGQVWLHKTGRRPPCRTTCVAMACSNCSTTPAMLHGSEPRAAVYRGRCFKAAIACRTLRTVKCRMPRSNGGYAATPNGTATSLAREPR